MRYFLVRARVLARGTGGVVSWDSAEHSSLEPEGNPIGAVHMATTELTASTFEQTITDNDIVFVDFWADWCGPCKQFAPTFSKASEEHPDVVFGKVDTEAEQQLAAAAQISSIPMLMAFREGQLVFAQPGALPAQAFEELVQQVKDLDMEEVRKQMAEEEAKEG